MKLEEAIRVNTVLKGAPVLKDDPTIIAALNLDIEACKVLIHGRLIGAHHDPALLPGETKE